MTMAELSGKTPLLVGGQAGGVTVNILAAMFRLTRLLLDQGIQPRTINRALRDCGFGSGAAALLEEWGPTTVDHILKNLGKYKPLLTPGSNVELWSSVLSLDEPGCGTGNGALVTCAEADGMIIPLVDAKEMENTVFDPGLLKQPGSEQLNACIRMLYFGVIEMQALRVLEQGVVDHPGLLDYCATTGAVGFPEVLGGPVYHIEDQGPKSFLRACVLISASGPTELRPLFEPCPMLVRGAERDKFYGD